MPNYEVLSAEQNIEIRSYQSMIVAEVEVEGERKDAIGDGFRLLADYIFGNNTVKKDRETMASVQQQGSQKIAMTAPVQQQSTGRSWKVNFVMPPEYSMESLPKPNNNRVVLEAVPPKKFAVILFSGTPADARLKIHEKRLMQYIKAHQIDINGLPKYAFYNSPWTLPWLRRNEVMVEIDEQ